MSQRTAPDPGLSTWQYRGEIWVVCPRCEGPARSTRDDSGKRHRLVCKRCGHAAAIHPFGMGEWVGGPTDGRFGLPLFLSATVRGNDLWVYNLGHLDALAAWIGAPLRGRAPLGEGYRNKTMMSRLPLWMKRATMRPHIVRALADLRRKGEREGLS